LSQLQTVRMTNSLDSKGMFTQKLSNRLSIRIYRDCRPNYLETGALQKGLVQMLDGEELIEEGVGFGVPVVKYEDKTFFSSQADVSIREIGRDIVITKVFTLDTVSLKKFGRVTYINDALYSPLRKAFESLYLKNKRLTPFFNKAMEFRDFANIKTEFVKVKPRGKVTMRYCCQSNGIDVRADFSKVALNKCVEILVLNEQGSSFFQRYFDSSGLNLVRQKIGAWETVEASQASLECGGQQVSFCLQNHRGARLFRGWEHTRKRFSWAGLSYSMRPNNAIFAYSVGLRSN